MAKHLKPRKKHRGGDVPAFGSADPNAVVTQPKTPAPATSWWIGLNRQAFRQQLPAEVSRMSGSTFGKGKKLITNNTGVAQS